MRSHAIKAFLSVTIFALALGGLTSSASANGYRVIDNRAKTVRKVWNNFKTSFIHNKGKLPGGGKWFSRYTTDRVDPNATVKAYGKVTQRGNKGAFTWKEKTWKGFGDSKHSHYVQRDEAGNKMFTIRTTTTSKKSISKVTNADGSKSVVKTWNTRSGNTFGIATEIAADGTKSVVRFGGKTAEQAPEPLFLRQYP